MDKDLIVIILAAVFGILSAIMGKKKKAAERQQQTPPPFGSDPYETVEYPTDSDFHGTEASLPEEDAGPWSYDSQIIDETTRQMPVGIKTEHTINKLGRDIKSNKHKQDAGADKDAEARSAESEKTDILWDFSLRDAVIYSELLKPKFED